MSGELRALSYELGARSWGLRAFVAWLRPVTSFAGDFTKGLPKWGRSR